MYVQTPKGPKFDHETHNPHVLLFVGLAIGSLLTAGLFTAFAASGSTLLGLFETANETPKLRAFLNGTLPQREMAHYYSISLERATELRINLTATEAGLALFVKKGTPPKRNSYDAKVEGENPMEFTLRPSSENSAITGEYIIMVYAEDRAANYTLTIELSPDTAAEGFSRLGSSVGSKNDPDNDGVSTKAELRLGTDPYNPDTDGDMLWDGVEVRRYGLDPKVSLFEAQATHRPWTGSWWPMARSSYGGNLYSDGGPLEKYDKYVTLLTGRNPGSKEYEMRSVLVGGHFINSSTIYEKTAERDFGYDINGDGDQDDAWDFLNNKGEWDSPDGDTNDSVSVGWWGHCNGQAAAACMEPEPKRPVTIGNITFTVDDIKGLLTELHNDDYAESVGKRYNGPGDDKDDIHPANFHITLLKWLGMDRRPAAMDRDCGEYVWNYAFGAYKMIVRQDEDVYSKVHIITNIEFAGSWGGHGSKYEYELEFEHGDIKGKGVWSGYSKDSHPDFLWRPIYQKSGNPMLKYSIVKEILKRSIL